MLPERRTYRSYYKKKDEYENDYSSFYGNYNESYGSFCDGLEAVSWENHSLPDFTKNFYIPHPTVLNRPYADVQQYRESRGIKIEGDADNNNNPIMYFEEGNFPDYVAGTIKKMGFDFPTAIQAQSWPIALSGRNMVGIAQTGSGKTLAYMLPAVIHSINQPRVQRGDGPIVLVLTPTRELAQQIQAIPMQFGDVCRQKAVAVFGGAPKGPQARDLENGADIVIATPGRLIDFLTTDVENVMYVINYDFPKSSEDYIHRIGRTGRSNSSGTAYTFFTSANQRQAKDLISVLAEAKQQITPELQSMIWFNGRRNAFSNGGNSLYMI
ncbi:unnamed protein product [Nezara viridula]|uniref:Helicase ATP-binding domain-containing protein n=1 Tax=Nezara viridula TaxID=85310 RepID=A0A9P0MLM1_NEZVI|nr:unnamed protein product [Nezara viridula]